MTKLKVLPKDQNQGLSSVHFLVCDKETTLPRRFVLPRRPVIQETTYAKNIPLYSTQRDSVNSSHPTPLRLPHGNVVENTLKGLVR